MAISLNNQGVRTPRKGGLGIRVHTFRRGLLVKFRKSPHRTEKALRHAQKPATPRSANPIGPESTYVEPGEDPPMANPPQGPKNDVGETLPGPSRPFPALIETGKSYPKTGLFRRFPGGFPAVFSASSTAVFRRFSGGFPTVLPVVSRRFPDSFTSGLPAVSNGFPAVFQRFSSGFPEVFRRFPGGFPAVLRRFPGGSTAVFQRFPRRFSRQVRRRFDGGFPATRFPWINPQPAPAYLFIRKKLSAIPYTLSGVQTQHSGIFESVFVTKRLAKLAGTNKN